MHGSAGYRIVIQTDFRCGCRLRPRAQVVFQRGPNSSDNTNSNLTGSVGLSLGRSINLSSGFAVVPFVQGGVGQFHRAFAYTNGLPRASVTPMPNIGVWRSTNTLYGEMGVGIGFRFNNMVTITPAFRAPLSDDRNAAMEQQTFSLSASAHYRK